MVYDLVKSRETNAPPTFLASDPEYNPLSTRPLAWLNLSHLENARVFVIVRTSAITVPNVSFSCAVCSFLPPRPTNQWRPLKLQLDEREDRQSYPHCRLSVQSQPEEPLVRCIHHLSTWLIRLGGALEDPLTVTISCVYFIPPAKPNKPASGDVLEVIEVDSKEQDREDEDEDEVADEEQAEEVHEQGACRCQIVSMLFLDRPNANSYLL